MSKKIRTEAVDYLFSAILSLENKEECYTFFEDICTINELLSLSQRFEVAKMLREQKTYLEIAEKTGASTATISRVNRSLNYGNDGYDMVFKPLSYAQDTERQLTIPERFQDVYINYMLSKIDYHNQETERYNNDVVMYNSAYDAYAAWFRRTHKPKRGAMFSKF